MNAMGNQSKVYGIEFCSSKDINLNIKSITEGCVENPKFDVTAGDDKTIPLLKPITIDKIYAKNTKARQSEQLYNRDSKSKKRFSLYLPPKRPVSMEPSPTRFPPAEGAD